MNEFLKSKSMCPVFYVSDLQPAPNMRNSSPCIQPPEVPLRNHVVQKQNLVCSRTTSVSGSSSTPSATERKLFTNIQPVKLHDLRPSVAVNLKSLKKKFQKKMSNPQENVYAEITNGPNDSSEVIENEYQEITGELTFRVPPQHHTDVRLNDPMLPQEYRSPPPFAPGYWDTGIHFKAPPIDCVVNYTATPSVDSKEKSPDQEILTTNLWCVERGWIKCGHVFCFHNINHHI